MEKKELERLLGAQESLNLCESEESRDSVDAWREEVENLNETISRKKKKLKKLKRKKKNCFETETRKKRKLKRKIRDLEEYLQDAEEQLQDAKEQLRRAEKRLMEKDFENLLLNIQIGNQKQILELQSQIKLLQQDGKFKEGITQILFKEAVPGLVSKYGKRADAIEVDFRELERA